MESLEEDATIITKTKHAKIKIKKHTTKKEPAAAAEGDNVLAPFLYAIKRKGTKGQYFNRLKCYFDYLGISDGKKEDSLEKQASKFLAHAIKEEEGNKWAEGCLIDYITYQKELVENKKITGGTVGVHHAAIKLFYDANDIQVNWRKINRGLPEASTVANDRAPTPEELRKLVEYTADRRVKVIVLVMISSGIRIGSWDHLKWKDVEPIKIKNEETAEEGEQQVIVAAKLRAYDTKKARHYTSFITGEAFQALQEYMDFRASYGEQITGESWLLRDKFPTATEGERAAIRSTAKNPKKLEQTGIKKALNRALWAQGLRDLLPEGEHRHEWKMSHGFRKFFKTNAERAGMLSANVEMLMDHAKGVSDSYWRPTEQQLLDDYLKAAVDYLTINKDHKIATQLQKQVTELTEKSEEQNYVIIGKLAEKDKELEDMRTREAQTTKQIQELAESMHKFRVQFEELSKKDEYHMSAYDDPKRLANIIKNLQSVQKYQKENPGEPFPWDEMVAVMEKDKEKKEKNR